MKLEEVEECIYKIPAREGMRVPALVFSTPKMLSLLQRDRTLEQIKNVAKLPYIVSHACVMPDGHEGYGFPIGGVAAFDADEGIISPGGVGYDINCGVRLIATPLTAEELNPYLNRLLNLLFENVPSGVGSEGKLKITKGELDEVAQGGSAWAIEQGYGKKTDLERTEERGSMQGAMPEWVSERAKARGKDQLGTLGAGNHFLEIQVVEEIRDAAVAKVFGLFEGQVVLMVHCGSRGYGHQICADYVREILEHARRENLFLPDKELAYAHVKSKLGERYFGAMKCAVNFAFANRQIIMHWIREVFEKLFKCGDELELVYDVAHNIAKIEEHQINGEMRKVVVHRKGATRAFPKGRKELPAVYSDVGQPVLIPGSMGTASYVLVGSEKSLKISFGSTCHGAGRIMSRKEATRRHNPNALLAELSARGIAVRAMSKRVVAEEAPTAYKDVDEVVKAVEKSGISKIIARLHPIGVVKG